MRSNKTINYFSSFINEIPDLSGKEKTVLLGRLKKTTHAKIGTRWSVTEGRIRQLENAGIKKIKSKTRQLTLFKTS